MMTYLNTSKLISALDARVADDMENSRVGGAGICVMQDGRVLYKKYHGVKSHATAEPLTDANGDTTLFRLASMTKPVTAVATLIQVGRGLLELDEPIDRLLPAFAEMDIGVCDEDGTLRRVGKAQTRLTPRILLNHTNGLGTLAVGEKQASAMMAADRQSLASVVDYIGQSALAFEPMTAQMYSSLWAFDVLARLVELTSGQDYTTFLQTNIFQPCGMTETVFAPTEAQWSRMIAIHDRAECDGQAYGKDAPTVPGCVFGDLPVTYCAGGAGLASTLPDYVRFAEMLLSGGCANGVQVVPRALVEAMGTPTVPESIMPFAERWGLGVRVIVGSEHWMPKGCFGWSGAYGSHFWVDPTNRITAVYMRNSAYDGGAGAAISCRFEQDVYGALSPL